MVAFIIKGFVVFLGEGKLESNQNALTIKTIMGNRCVPRVSRHWVTNSEHLIARAPITLDGKQRMPPNRNGRAVLPLGMTHRHGRLFLLTQSPSGLDEPKVRDTDVPNAGSLPGHR